jgi:hypothetical protein
LKWVLDRSKKNSDVEAISLKKDVAKRQINEIWICFLKNGEIGYNWYHDVSTLFFDYL